MLRSPLASARLPPPSLTLASSYGRPRSRTAPSTPLVEAPSYPPVELPGSTPERPRASYHHSYDNKLRKSMRPSSHVKRPSHPWLHLPADHKSTVPSGDRPEGVSSKNSQPPTPQQQQQTEGSEVSTYRLSKPASHPRRIWSDPIQSRGILRPVSSHPRPDNTAGHHTPQLSSTPRPTGNEFQLASYESTQSSAENSQVAYASSLHASHEAHVAALLEAHQRELATLHLYIEQLEPRHGLSRSSEVHAHPSVRHHSRIQGDDKTKSVDSWRSTTPPHHDFHRQSNPRDHNHGAGDSHCTSLAGCGEIWLECNHLRRTLEQTNTRLVQSQEEVYRLQGAEKSLKATVEDLRSRLMAANDQRLDAQEGLHDACCRVRGLAEREACLVHELEELQKCASIPAVATPSRERHDEFFTLAQQHVDQNTSTPGPKAEAHSPSPSLSQSQTPSPSALGISIPTTPRTITSATAEALLVTTSTPDAYIYPRTPPAGVHKELPLPPVDASPVPVRLRRGETMKSVGESIIELYARQDGDGWERGWSADGVGGTQWVEWV